MNPWGDSIKAANQHLGTAVEELGDLITWFKRDIVGREGFSEETVTQVRDSLAAMSDSLHNVATTITGVADAQSRATLKFLGGSRLNREEFYILLASETVEWTNKTMGLAAFEDYELFDLLRYEGEDQSGYIYLAADIEDLPAVDPDDWTLAFITRTYRKAIIAPEAIRWSTLSSKQRAFFKTYLPEMVGRFLHDE